MRMGPAIQSPSLALHQLGPSILVGQARKLIFYNLTSLFVYGNLSIKKTWVTLRKFSWTQALGVNPWFHLLYFTDNSSVFKTFPMLNRDRVIWEIELTLKKSADLSSV